MTSLNLRRIWVLMALAAAFLATQARAELVLSQVILDLGPDRPPREDIEIFNNGTERLYVSAEPFEILDPGLPEQERIAAVDPTLSGILVTPQKVILEPGERRLIRVAMTGPRGASDRIFRVTIKPVAGEISARSDALKVLVGYDTLVLYRTARSSGRVSGTRDGNKLVIQNESNTTQELSDGTQCDSNGQQCQSLPGRRLYPGTQWEQAVPFETPVVYQVSSGGEVSQITF